MTALVSMAQAQQLPPRAMRQAYRRQAQVQREESGELQREEKMWWCRVGWPPARQPMTLPNPKVLISTAVIVKQQVLPPTVGL
mmetsp:Transcript_29975/g.70528  ORF Transcript_29975/g.70528 Transcript_29975/m.70528 type:complete len:83 (+) Transcript_29975:806-1054(+)